MSKIPIGEKPDFRARLEDAWPERKWRDVSVLVAVSGGADSVALASALHSVRTKPSEHSASPPLGRFEVAHFNHRWRGEASDQDEQFVREFCDAHQMPLHVGQAEDAKQSEEAARNERYNFLHSLAKRRGARYIAMAHTANDQAETVLHRVLRGTGLRGLRGIQFARKLSEAVTVVRPLLWANRDDVLSFLQSRGQAFRTDSSNQNTDYTRNRIRLELLPQLAKQYNVGVHDGLVRLATIASEAVTELQPMVSAKLDECWMTDNLRDISADEVMLNRDRFQSSTPFMQREVLQSIWRKRGWPAGRMSFEHWNRMVETIAIGGTQSLPGGVQLRADENVISLQRGVDAKQDR